MGRTVGIDLGTTNSCVATHVGGRTIVIPDENGYPTTPSAVARMPDGKWLVGREAKAARQTGMGRAVVSIKRLMGRRLGEVTQDAKRIGCGVTERPDLNISLEVGESWLAPQEISARILMRMKEIAERWLKESVTSAVITVPAYFDQPQRKATQEAGQIAGLKVLRIINEPTASAIAYGLQKTGPRKVAVFDLGGGTFDVSILDIREGVFEVQSTGGNSRLGGDDLDWLLTDYLAESCIEQMGVDPRTQFRLLSRMLKAAEMLKIELSSVAAADVCVDVGKADPFCARVERRDFERLIMGAISQTVPICQQTLRDARLTSRDIDDLVLVGGSTLIPCVRALAADSFDQEPRAEVNPNEVVAVGAAMQAAMLDGTIQDALLLDVIPLSLGVETLGGVFRRILPRNTKIPAQRGEIFSTAEDNQPAVKIHILQGERELADDNRTLGQFDLVGIDPAPRGGPKIEVTFDVDSNGLLHVAAENLHTGESVRVDVNESLALSPCEIERMIESARQNKLEDQKLRERVLALNDLQGVVSQCRKSLAHYGEKISPERRAEIISALEKIGGILETGATAELRDATDWMLQLCEVLREAERESLANGCPVGTAPREEEICHESNRRER